MSAPASAPRLAFGVVLGISIVLASSAGALASTVSVGGGTLSYSADPNEINEVTIERVGGFFRVRDDTATLSTVDPDCTEINAHLTRCLQAPVTDIEALGRDQGDTITVAGARPATISGGGGSDAIVGGDGDDTLSAGPGSTPQLFSETIFAGEGDDVLRGSTTTNASTTMIGGPGNDTIAGGPGFDTVSGDDGADVLRGGGGTNDAVNYGSSPVGVNVTINDVANDGAPGEHDDVRTDIEGVSGSGFADVINGSDDSEFLSGQAGVDTVRGFGGNDFLNGGPDADTIVGGDDNDSMRGGFGAPAADVFLGGDGTDGVVYDDRPDASPLSLTLNDTADDGVAGENDNIRQDVENVDGGPGDDTIVGDLEDNLLQGRDGNDDISGAGGDDLLRGDVSFGGSGNDDLNGGGADDVLIGGAGGNDDFRGSSGFDTVSYVEQSTGAVITIDGVANDGEPGENDNVRTDVESVFGTNGPDDITGSSAADVLSGFGGADTLDGAGGDDLLDGEGPQFLSAEGDVLIGGAGVDAVSYLSHLSFVTADIDDIADDGVVGENDRIRTSVENLFGSLSSDTLSGSADPNIVDGGQGTGADIVNGLGGADFVSGGLGFDSLNGDSGNDRVQSRDGGGDNVDCGPNTDSAEADAADVLANCENVFNTRPLVPTAPSHRVSELERIWKTSKRRLAWAAAAADRVR